MRLRIRYQLSAFVLVVTLTSIGILAIVTWYNNHNLVVNLRLTRLALVASLKAEQVTSKLEIIQNGVASISTRAILTNALKRFELGNNTDANWANSLADLGLVLSTQTQFLQISVYTPTMNDTLLNITSATAGVMDSGLLPIHDSSGATVAYNSINGNAGFPSDLYTTTASNDSFLLGPVPSLTDSTLQIGSITVPIYNNTTVARAQNATLGILTVVFTTSSLSEPLSDTQGLDTTGELFLTGPKDSNIAAPNSGWPGNASWRYILPPQDPGIENKLGGFWTAIAHDPDGRGSLYSTTNPSTGARVAVGFAPLNFTLVNWTLIAQQDYSEVSEPIRKLRDILLGTVFGMAAVAFLATCILTSIAVRPISRLREATERTTRPPGYSPTASDDGDAERGIVRHRKKWWQREKMVDKIAGPLQSASFRVPQRVPDRKHFVTDELTELTETFNEMTEELLRQYEHLEDRVATRTAELKEQTQLANAANDAKSMFIANVTHELRTPLNGIMGLCSVIMTEPNLPTGVRRNLGTVYKSGELLLCLLTDLLTFSRNQVAGVNVVLEEREFKVRDLVTQIKAIFLKTARDKRVELGIEVVDDGVNVKTGKPSVNGILRGDINRILQVVINLVSNSLKFTPERGSVQLRIGMLSEDMEMIVPEEREDLPTTFNMPKTAIINPNTPANQAINDAKAQRMAASLGGTLSTDGPSMYTPLSDAATYFDTSATEVVPEAPLVIDEHVETRWFEFAVIDTGPGIPPEMHSKIFEPFVQGDLGLSKKYGGTGLGLSICKQLAELMGGVIELKSFEGAGSTFTLRIPLKAGGLPAAHIPGNTRPGSLATTRFSRAPDQRSVRSIASTSYSHDATRLVGLSQPYFAPEVADHPDHQMPPVPAADLSSQPSDSLNISLPSAIDFAIESPSPMPRAADHYFEPARSSSKKVRMDPEIGESSKPRNSQKIAMLKQHIRVLVAEDNKVNQQVLRKMLKLESVTDIDIAEDGKQALEKFKQSLGEERQYEVIFMDIQMPIMDGLEATKGIRELGYVGPIVALTAFAEESNVKECFEVGIDLFLQKPLKRNNLRDTLKRYCSTIPEREEPQTEDIA